MSTKHFLLVLLFFLPFHFIRAQEGALTILKDGLATWPELARHVTIETASERSVEGRKVLSGKATAYGQSITLKGLIAKSQGKKKLERLSLIFPEGTQLNRQNLSGLAGTDLLGQLPAGLDANLKLDEIMLEFAGKKVLSAQVNVSTSVWQVVGQQDLKVSDIKASFALLDPMGREKNVAIGITGKLMLPAELTKYFGFGARTLGLHGFINTQTKRLTLYADLSSEKIPLGNQEVISLRNAFIEVFMEKQNFGMAIGGKVELNMPGQTPIMLNGEVSIDLSGAVFGQGWMTGTWHNPFGISDQLYITNLGLGFGLDFSKPPYPLPIVGLEGGLVVGSSPDPGQARFSGKVTLGVHAGNPSKNMLDARNINANLFDLASAFYPPGIPNDLQTLFKSIQLKNARLTVVAPGDAPVVLFGQSYYPGVHIEGEYQIGSHSGAMLLAINADRLIAYNTMAAIKTTRFSFTNFDQSKGPEAYISIRKGGPLGVTGGFGLDGNLNVLGVSAAANIYLTDDGFNVSVKGKILNAFEGKLDIAGADLLGNGSIYVSAEMEQDLFSRINKVAADEIGKTARTTNAAFEKVRGELATHRPILQKKKARYEQVKATVKADYDRLCKEKGNIDQQKEAREKAKAAKTKQIAAKDNRIKQLKAQIADGFRPATFIKKTTCSNLSQYDPRNGGECWQCPSGYQRDVVVPVNSSRACFKPAYEDFKPAIYKGKSTGSIPLMPKTDCPSGAYYDPIDGGTCWSNPPGYNRTAGFSVKSSKATSRVIPEARIGANKLASLACTGPGQFVDIPRGECWECPPGYTRPATTEPVTGKKACEKINMLDLRADLLKEEGLREALVAERDLILGKIGDLSDMITKEMQTACEGLANSELVNADPRVAPIWSEYTAERGVLEGLEVTLKGLQDLSVGTLNAAKWVVENGGEAMGVVDIRRASFSGCLSKMAGGTVALKVEGTYAGKPLSASFNCNLKSPDAMIRAFADALLATNTSKSTLATGNCRRVQVKSPFEGGDMFAELTKEANRTPLIVGPRPSQPVRPGWAGPRRYADGDFDSQLKKALEAGNTDKMLEMAGYGIDLNVRDKQQATPLMWAAYRGSSADVAFLIGKGADPKLKGAVFLDGGNGRNVGSLLGIAAEKGDLELMAYLVGTLGLPVDGREFNASSKRADGLTAIERAAGGGKSALVTYLLEQGASPAASPAAVLLATAQGHVDLAEQLLEKGFGFTAGDAKGFQPLHLACQAGQSKLVRQLLDRGAPVNATTNAGWSPLVLAACEGDQETVTQLLMAGADRKHKYNKKTAEKWAKKKGFKDLAKYIKAYE